MGNSEFFVLFVSLLLIKLILTPPGLSTKMSLWFVPLKC